jgi:hypothetical protein
MIMRRSLLLLSLLSVFCLPMLHAAEASRSLPSFIAINCKGPVSLTVEVGKSQSVKVSGDERFVADLRTEVIDNELNITLPKSYNTMKGDPRVTISLPSLSRVKLEGAGENLINNINTDRIDISYLGAGRLRASGKTKYLRLSAKGVGEVDTKALQADRVDVNFEGVGAVSVFASDTLNAIARGMGSLNYYGHPRTINKSVQGIGSVQAAD